MPLGASDGYFTDSSAIRRMHLERPVLLMGPRFVLMQAAHPLVVSGLYAHSSAMDDPYTRLDNTTAIMTTIGYGSRADADRETAAVRELHVRAKGKLRDAAGPFPAGTPYRANDPELLMWVLFSMVDSALVVYDALVAQLSRDERAAYWEDMKVVGMLFGLERHEMPATLADLDDYRDSMLAGGQLAVSDWARRKIRSILFGVPAPLGARPAVWAANHLAIAMLPPSVRAMYGSGSFPRAREALVAGVGATSRALYPRLPERMRHAIPAEVGSASESPEPLPAAPA